jgi:fatty acid desaturase
MPKPRPNPDPIPLIRRWLEFVLNDANYHLPQHLHGGVPFYHARAATEAIKAKLGPFITTAQLNGRLVRALFEKWQVYDEARGTYTTMQQAMKGLDEPSQAAIPA